jgi:spore coat protein U-like protein
MPEAPCGANNGELGMLSSWKSRILLAAAAIVVGSTSVLAQETDTLTVQVTVQEACSIAGTTIDFGTYTAGQQAALNAQGNISYNNCAAGTLTIALDGGGAGNVANRVMANGGGDTLKGTSKNGEFGTDCGV